MLMKFKVCDVYCIILQLMKLYIQSSSRPNLYTGSYADRNKHAISGKYAKKDKLANAKEAF